MSKNLELKEIRTFGCLAPKKDSWVSILLDSGLAAKSWRLEPELVKKLETSLSLDVEKSYINIFDATFVDLDSTIEYRIVFDNLKKLFILTLKNRKNSSIELLPEERVDVIKSELVKKVRLRAFDLIKDAHKLYLEKVDQHLRDGELIKVDEVKLNAILNELKSSVLLDNLKLGKFAQ